MQLTDSLRSLCSDTAKSLKGSARRLFMARTVKALGPGGQRCAAREFAWSRVTICDSDQCLSRRSTQPGVGGCPGAVWLAHHPRDHWR